MYSILRGRQITNRILITFVLHLRSSSCVLFSIFFIFIDVIALMRNICYAMSAIAIKNMCAIVKYNSDVSRNIRFFINLYLYLYLFKLQFSKATSKTWTGGLGLWKTWAWKNMDSRKHRIYMRLKNMSDFTELSFNKIYVSTHNI